MRACSACDGVFAQMCVRTILHFGAELALLGVLKQRMVAFHLVPRLTAGLVKQGPVPTGRRAGGEREGGRGRGRRNRIKLKYRRFTFTSEEINKQSHMTMV